MDAWLRGYYKRREKLNVDITKYPNCEFPASLGLRMHRMDVEWWSHNINDPVKRQAFQAATHKLIAGKKFANGMDVPRGLEIERLYYMIAKGYSAEQYAAHAASYD
jgi:hypothetical protein